MTATETGTSPLADTSQTLEDLSKKGFGVRTIAKYLGMSKSQVYREQKALGLNRPNAKRVRSHYREVRSQEYNPQLSSLATMETDTTRPAWKSGYGKHQHIVKGIIVVSLVNVGKRKTFDLEAFPENANQKPIMDFYEKNKGMLLGQVLKGDIGCEYGREIKDWAMRNGIPLCLVRSRGGVSKPYVESLNAFKCQYYPLFKAVKDLGLEERLFTTKWVIAHFKALWSQSLTNEEKALLTIPLEALLTRLKIDQKGREVLETETRLTPIPTLTRRRLGD